MIYIYENYENSQISIFFFFFDGEESLHMGWSFRPGGHTHRQKLGQKLTDSATGKKKFEKELEKGAKGEGVQNI